jgi:predicted enzyme related to lactoylglutathione lyase
MRGRLVDALPKPFDPPFTPRGEPLSRAVQFRNGHRQGDISYISLVLPDPARGEAFYGALLGWSFSPGQMGREQGGEVTPEVGLWNGARSGGTVVPGVILGYRVNDVATVAVRVRSAGGVAKEPQERPYGIESKCVDNQGGVVLSPPAPRHPD